MKIDATVVKTEFHADRSTMYKRVTLLLLGLHQQIALPWLGELPQIGSIIRISLDWDE